MLKRIKELFGKRSGEGGRDRPVLAGGADAGPAPPVHRGPRVIHHPIPESDLDPEAVKIVRRLTRFGHTTYLVGGCVRDLLLDRKPKDFDLGTAATPRQVKRLFRNCRIIGRRFRLAHIYFHNGKIIEVATFRATDDEDDDATPTQGQDVLIRDDNVFGTPEEDALRRDFTINALFYDLHEQTVLDHTDGLGDLRRRVVRTIGDPVLRFRQDPVRILRAVKFAARLGFDIEKNSLRAIKATRPELTRAAPPRVLEELNRFCRGGAAARSFELLRETRVLETILPEFARGYAADSGRWDLLAAFMEGMDRRVAEGNEIHTGEIFAVLVLPLLVEKFGWKVDGTSVYRRDLDVRREVDDRLQPVAARLRLSRKDQEHCRQILLVLQRLVPVDGVRRSTRRSLARRTAFPDALWALEILAEQYGKDFAEAAGFWGSGAVEAFPVETSEVVASPDADTRQREPSGTEGGRRGGRRRRRRRPRRSATAPQGKDGKRSAQIQAKGETPSAPAKPARPAQPKRKKSQPETHGGDGRELPPPWDDRYFFAALPSVPEIKGAKDVSDRYGAAELTPGEPEKPDGDQPEGPTPPARSRTRRPRRRKRRKPRSHPPKNGGESTEGTQAASAPTSTDRPAGDS